MSSAKSDAETCALEPAMREFANIELRERRGDASIATRPGVSSLWTSRPTAGRRINADSSSLVRRREFGGAADAVRRPGEQLGPSVATTWRT
jgi:hypothetical protein